MIHIKNYLNKLGYKVNIRALEIISLCDSWYSNEQIDDFHSRMTVNGVHYNMERTGFAKRACEDDANLCEVVDISLANKNADEFISNQLVTERFQRSIREQLELMAAQGTVGAYVRTVGADLMSDGTLKGGNIELIYVKPSGIFPLTINKGIVTECAFASVDVVGGKAETTIVIFKVENGKYKAITAVLNHEGRELKDRYTDVDLGDIKPFAILTTAIVNNLKDMYGYGLPKLYGAIPVLKTIDLVFNVLFGDLDKADKMVLYNEALCEFDASGKPITPNKQHKKTFVSMGKKLPETKELVQEINPEIRVDEIIKTFELALSLLSTMFGFGTRKYSFENGQIKTATEYIGTKQDSMQELNRQRQNLTDYIRDIVKALLWFSNAFYKTNYNLNFDDKNNELVINYDDSFITDRQSELESMRADAQAFGLPKLVKNYLQNKYGLTEDEAEAWYSDSEIDDETVKS
ncbi:MAG: hypothetical protein PUK21_01480 [Peptostreptococcaceae bacterium]|nr:hypothetical protein [Peptostreptococcaceae bacterium]MDY5738680.1 hypothetical protein [Anaerovoracaceae bacterium]